MKKSALILALSAFIVSIACGQTEPKAPIEMVPFSMIWENSKDSKLNLSFLLDKPAGKNGFISIKNGHFVKPTGERFKMWGVNLTGGACFPEKKDAPLVAAYLARFGINCVRLHYMDATLSHIYSNWKPEMSLIDYSKNTTRELNIEQLDKLDFLVSELKKVGIYSDINLNVGRSFKKEDGVVEYEFLGTAIKAVSAYDDRIIELQKEYAKQLLTHLNPYTGNTYTNEPAIALVEIVNENSLIDSWMKGKLQGKSTTPTTATWIDIPPYYSTELTKKYNEWLKTHISADKLEQIRKESGVLVSEEIPRLIPKEFKDASELRFHTEAEFIISTEQNFYKHMSDYLKHDLGVKCPIVANSDHSHNKTGNALLSATSLLDVVDGHEYWQHPESVLDKKTGKRFLMIENTPMVNQPEMSTVVHVARSAVEGKPFIISEYNHPAPNEYVCEGFPIFTAYASMQDWDGIFAYTLEHVPADKWNTNYAIANSGAFDMGLDPVKMAGIAANAILFQRNDLKPAESCVNRGYSKYDIIEGTRDVSKDEPFFTKGFSPLIALTEKTRINSFDKTINNFPLIENKNEINSKTGEISWHVSDKSFVEVAAPKTESVIGFIPEKTTKLKHLQARIQNNFAAVSLISVDNKPIATANQLLLVTTARSGMTGMKFSDDRQRLVEPGAKPTTIEVVKGKIILSGLTNAKSVRVESLDGSGNPFKNKTSLAKKGVASFTIGDDVTVWYLLTIKR